MSKVMVLQHVAWEVLGSLDPLLKQNGFRIRYVNFGRTPELVPNLEKYEGLIILGGPMSVNDTKRFPHLSLEIKLIEQALKEDIPILGICLGAQLMAKALGAKIKKMPVQEIGWYPVQVNRQGASDRILSPIKNSQRLFHWHGDTFEMPKGCHSLASSEICENQALRVSKKAYGFQFHLEVDEKMIKRWLTVPSHKKDIAQLRGLVQPKMILQDTQTYFDENLNVANQVFSNWLDLFPKKNKQEILGSR